MKVDEVKAIDDEDFRQVQQLCDDHTGWAQVYNKKNNSVWTKPAPESGLLMFKARSVFSDVPGSVVYDVLHDPNYRTKWDKYMIAAKDIGILNPNNDLCYYALGAFPPIRGRDFVMQRSWLDTGKEKYICGHSVCHDDFPPQKGLIRGTIYLTAYFVRELGANECEVTYITHSDPKGKLPTWLINRVTKAVAPKALKKLHKTCQNYPAWKNKHEPHWKPWLFPEQLQAAPRIKLEQCRPRVYDQQIVDESNLAATDENKDKDSDNEDV
uniref:START domain-containing protein 10 n=1 Tax=Panagrellus redivivus TaxID=6233 RepID=A0A7E4VUT0_PANRE